MLPLKRLRASLPPETARSVAQSTLTLAQFVSCGELELVEKLDLPLDEQRHLAKAVVVRAAPPVYTATQLLSAPVTGATSLSTGLAQLDAHLGGGLPVRAVSELVGPAGAGKSELCHTLAARALVDGRARGARVHYVDTDYSFSAVRLVQLIVHALLQQGHATSDPMDEAKQLADRMTVWQASSWALLTTCLGEQLEAALLGDPMPAALIVIDAIGAVVQRHFDGSDVPRRQQAVGAQAARLKYFADEYGVGVVCVNQVVGGGSGYAGGGGGGSGAFGTAGRLDGRGQVGCVLGRDDTQLSAYMGTAWAHYVNARLVLHHAPTLGAAPPPLPFPPPPGSLGPVAATPPMRLTVAKAPMCAEATFEYRVCEAGLLAP